MPPFSGRLLQPWFALLSRVVVLAERGACQARKRTAAWKSAVLFPWPCPLLSTTAGAQAVLENMMGEAEQKGHVTGIPPPPPPPPLFIWGDCGCCWPTSVQPSDGQSTRGTAARTW